MGKKKLLDETYFVTKRVGRAVHEAAMLPDGCTALVAVSGGPCSLALLQALLARERRVPTTAHFVAGYVPDGVHGDDRQTIEALTRICDGWRIPLHVASACSDPDVHFKATPHQTELLKIAGQVGASVIALGQTMDDRALLVLLSVVRSGLLDEVPVVDRHSSGVTFVRPLCHLTQEAVLNMARAEGFDYRLAIVEHADRAVHELLLAHLGKKRGQLIEKLRNLSISPENVNPDYLA